MSALVATDDTQAFSLRFDWMQMLGTLPITVASVPVSSVLVTDYTQPFTLRFDMMQMLGQLPITPAVVAAYQVLSLPTDTQWRTHLTATRQTAQNIWNTEQLPAFGLGARYFTPADFVTLPASTSWAAFWPDVARRANAVWTQDFLPNWLIGPRSFAPSELVALPNAGWWLRYFAFETDLRSDVQLALQTTFNNLQPVNLNIDFNAEPLLSNLRTAIVNILRSNTL